MKFVKKYKLPIHKIFSKIFFYAFNTVMKLFFTIVYMRIISLRWKFDDHPLVEYPLFQYFLLTSNLMTHYFLFMSLL